MILELKFTDRFPDWCREMLQRFNLVRGSAAKYCEVIDMLGLDRVRAELRAARQNGSALPPPTLSPDWAVSPN